MKGADQGSHGASGPKWWFRHPILEGVVGLIAAGLAWAPPFNSPTTALTIGAIAVFLSVGRYGLHEMIREHTEDADLRLAKKFERVDRLAEFVDLTPRGDIADMRLLIDRYVRITDQEFADAKEEIVRTASSKLNKILLEMRTEHLGTGAYFAQLNEILAKVKAGEKVVAVSTGDIFEWDDSPQEQAFFAANVDIVRRGGQVIRYFVYDAAMFAEAKEKNPKVAAHFTGSGPTGKFVDRDLLKQRDPQLLEAIGQGFLMVERRLAVIDVFGDTPRGYVTKNRDELDRYAKAIQQLNILSAP